MLGRLRTYPQPVFAQGPFLQHESLLLLVPHSVPALRLHGVKVEAEGLAGKEAACERGFLDCIPVNFKRTHLAALPEGYLHKVVLLSEGIPVFLGNGFAGLVDGLDNFRLRGDSHLNPCKVVRTLVDVKVEIELHAVGLDDMLAVALHLIVKAVLPIEQVGVLREGHPLGDSGGQAYGLDGLESLALATFDTGYYLLILRNIDFEILHGLIPSVGDEDNILEPRMLKFGDYHLYRTAVGHVARKFQIVDGKMRRKGVHDDFQCLLERQVLLVVSPADVHQVEPIGGDRRGVHGAVFVLAHPFGAKPEKSHPVLLCDILRQSRDAGTCERMHGGRLHYTLPLPDMGIGAAFKKQIICEGEHVLGHLHVAVKHFPEVIRQACLPGDVVQKPGGAVHPVEVSALVLHRAPMPGSGQGLDFGQVPFGREYQLTALFDRRIEVCRVWMKPHVVVNNAPVLVRVMLLAVVINSERLGGCVLPSSIVMDAYLVYRAGFGRSSCSHGIRYKY